MDDIIRMTVVINPLVSPLLHADLMRCRGPRERAMRLRAAAEAGIRAVLQRAPSEPVLLQAEAPAAGAPPLSPVVHQEAAVAILRVHDPVIRDDGLASTSLEDELANYF